MGIVLNLFLGCLMGLAKGEFPDVSRSWCKQFQYCCMLKTSVVKQKPNYEAEYNWL